MKRSYDTGMSQVSIVNAALEHYLEHVVSEDADPTPPAHNGGEGI